MTDDFLELGGWLVRESAIDAVGPSDEGGLLITRSGFRLILEPNEFRDLWKRFHAEGDWRQESD